MLVPLIWATLAACAIPAMVAFKRSRDVFHPTLYLGVLCAFVYVFIPVRLTRGTELFTYLTEEQAEFGQLLALLGITALMGGCLRGGRATGRQGSTGNAWSAAALQKGAIGMGTVGMVCWLFTIRQVGGFANAFGQAYGSGWSEYGYIRDAVMLVIVAIVLLLTPECFVRRDPSWKIAVCVFSAPYMIQGLLGARRGPTFVILLTLGMSWYLARRRRPALITAALSGLAVGLLMLFLVTNRGSIYLGSEGTFDSDVTKVVSGANESNEYIFGTGCIMAARQTGRFFWGKRYLAQIIVRPVPRQLWPSKYEDFGVGELEQNAGVAGGGLVDVMGWKEVPGAAAAMIADLWVEFSWGYLPVLWFVGLAYGSVWRRAVTVGGPWNSQYVILAALSVYLVTQSGEAVIFRLLILSLPTWWIWRTAALQPSMRGTGAYSS